jgi:predicted Zn-dependent protease
VFISRAQDTRRLAEDFRRTTYSFKRLNDQEAQELKPFRLKIHRVQAGDTIARLAQWMPKGPDPIRRFRVLNGLERNQTLKPGQLVKYVTF